MFFCFVFCMLKKPSKPISNLKYQYCNLNLFLYSTQSTYTAQDLSCDWFYKASLTLPNTPKALHQTDCVIKATTHPIK